MSNNDKEKIDMNVVNKINVHLRDNCNVRMKDSFRLAMIIVQNKEFILDILGGKSNEERKF
mgnify:CR=1 FL=1